ncbi:hypothetical protein ACTXT7_016908, partial [Hymenolepis weldensis]
MKDNSSRFPLMSWPAYPSPHRADNFSRDCLYPFSLAQLQKLPHSLKHTIQPISFSFASKSSKVATLDGQFLDSSDNLSSMPHKICKTNVVAALSLMLPCLQIVSSRMTEELKLVDCESWSKSIKLQCLPILLSKGTDISIGYSPSRAPNSMQRLLFGISHSGIRTTTKLSTPD